MRGTAKSGCEGNSEVWLGGEQRSLAGRGTAKSGWEGNSEVWLGGEQRSLAVRGTAKSGWEGNSEVWLGGEQRSLAGRGTAKSSWEGNSEVWLCGDLNLFSLCVVLRLSPDVQQILVTGSVYVQFAGCPACLAPAVNYQAPAEHRHEVVRFFSLHHPHLGRGDGVDALAH